jgi:branched-chain amino acid transport system substrate-binding protein
MRIHRTSTLVTATLLALLCASCGSQLDRQQKLAVENGLATRVIGGGSALQASATGGSGQALSPGGDSPAAGGNASSGSVTGAAGADSSGSVGSSSGAEADSGGASSGAASSGTGSSGGSVGGASGSAASGSGASGEGNASPIVLGTFGTDSGLVGANVASAPVGVRAVVAEINATGGLNGHPLKVIFGGDDTGDPTRALAIAKTLVDQDHVVGMLTPYAPLTMQAVLPYLAQQGIPVIADGSNIPQEDSSPIEFNPASSGNADGTGFVTTVVKQTADKKVAVFYLEEIASAGESNQTIIATAKKDGLDIVYDTAVSIAAPDFTAQILEARSAGAQDIICVTDFQTLLRIITSAQRQAFAPDFSGSLAFDQPIPSDVASEVNGLIAFSVTAQWASPQMAAYRAAVNAYVPGGQLGLLGTVAWVGGMTLEAIAPQFGPTVTKQSLTAALYTLKNTTLGGLVPKFSFTPGGSSPYLNPCILPIRFVNGNWTRPLGDEGFVCT